MRDLSCLTRDGTHTPSDDHWTAREVPTRQYFGGFNTAQGCMRRVSLRSGQQSILFTWKLQSQDGRDC